MSPVWRRCESVLTPLLRDDIDTDAIIPQTEVAGSDGIDFGMGLFARWRYDADRVPLQGFALNQQRYAGSVILAAGRNFGCGSSREHAVWALADYGIRCILAPSYGEIFWRNCLRGGIAALEVPASRLSDVVAACDSLPVPVPLAVDLEAGCLKAGDAMWPLDVPPLVWRYVAEGFDEIAATLESEGEIEAFERARQGTSRW